MFSHIQSRSYGLTNKRKLYNSANANLDFIQRLKLEKKLTGHSGCVNTICWNETGTTILSGSDDQYLVISDPFTEKTVYKLHSGHRANIFSAKFLPSSGDKEVVSCSGDGKIIYNNVLREDTHGTNIFDCHFGTTYEVIVIPNEASTFLSCGEDGTVRFFDLRAKTSCTKSECKEDVLINSRSAVTAIAANPLLPWQLAVGCSDSTARVYDRRMLGTRATGNYKGKGITGLVSLFTPPSLESMSYRITSLNYSPDGEDMLASYSSEYIYLYGTKDPSKISKISKHSGWAADKSEINRDDTSFEAVPGTSNPTHPARRADDIDDPNDLGARPSSVKRLRLRGDWSDTGPGARPERERRQNPQPNVSHPPQEGVVENPRITIMQRMSDLLTRWLDENLRQNQEGESNQPSSADQPSERPSNTSQGGDVSQETQNQSSILMANFQLEDADISDSEMTPASSHDHSMEAASMPLQEEEHSEIMEPTSQSTTSTDSHAGNQPDNNQPSSDMYNPLEPTSYIERKKSSESITNVEQLNITDGASCHDNQEISTACQSDSTASIKNVSIAEAKAPTTFSDAERSNYQPEKRSIIQETQQAVDELKNINVEPIISLHYSSEGTSYSNIQLRFATLRSDTETGSADRPTGSEGSQPGLHLDVAPTEHLAEHQDLRSNPCRVSSSSIDKHLENSNDETLETRNTANEDEDLDNTPVVNLASEDNAPVYKDHVTDKRVLDRHDCCNVNQGISEASINSKQEESSAMDISDAETEHIDHNKLTTVIESHIEPMCDNGQDSDSGNFSDKPELIKTVIEDSEKPSCSGAGGNADLNEASECQEAAVAALQAHSTEKADKEENMDVDESLHLAGTSDERQPAANSSQRRRRIGYSGPPTGDFQLPSVSDHHDNSSSSSSNDEEEDEPRNVLRRPRIDRTTAALRLQAFHRRRQEAKERKEMDDKSIYKPKHSKVYKGHRNARTMIKEANFWGNNFIVSGSDCGHIFIWDRHSTEPVMLLEADKHVVNCVQPHPFDVLLASSGIDYDIKLWSPLHDKSAYDEECTKEVIHRNQIMLEETRDTITVPAAFMLRVLASINNIRSGRRTDRAEASSTESRQEREESESD